MESEASVTLESCQEDSMLIQTVKDIVIENASNELESEEGFFVVTDVHDQQQSMIEVGNDEPVIQVEDRSTWTDLCRVCANVNNHLIPIFEGEGLQHELCNKIHKYLPIHVSENDMLPLQLCYHCAATLLAWHELSEGCLDAERRLLEARDSLQEKQFFNATPADGLETAAGDALPASDSIESLPQQHRTEKHEDCTELAATNSDRCKNEITESRSTRFSNFQKAYRLFLGVHKNQTKKTISSLKDSSSTTTNRGRRNVEIKEKEKRDNPGDLTLHPSDKKCAVCFLAFDCQVRLEKHVANAHNSESRLKEKQKTMYSGKLRKVDSITCKRCDKKFRSQEIYRTHLRVHTEKSYTCHVCGKQFGQTGSLYYHLKHVHAGIKNHSCDMCGRSFAMKSAMVDHRRIHTNERPYVCDSCGKTFRTKASLYIHNKTHTNEYPHKCAHCQKAFRWKQQMLGHLTIHTGEKNHVCDICGKGFGVRNSLTRHKRTHSEDKPYSCGHCGISFGQKRYLKSHERARHK